MLRRLRPTLRRVLSRAYGTDFTCSRYREYGATAITAALTITFLMGLSALAIDGSNIYRERGEVQNAADLAALAAAYESCTGGNDTAAATAGEGQAAANGYDGTNPNVVVSVVKDGARWRASIDSTVEGYFSPLLVS